MSIGIGENLGKSFGFAKDATFGHIGRWIGMAVLYLIPIVDFIVTGMFLKIFRKEEVDFSNAGKSFVQGLLAFIIQLIYMIIPLILGMVLLGASLIPAITTGGVAGVANAITGGLSIASLIITLVVAIIFALIMTPAIVSFARGGFGDAFKFSNIFAMIGKVGWGKYILSIIVLFLVLLVVGVVLGFICLIPILGLIVFILAMPFIQIWTYKFWDNLFE
ncbi:MAG: DUF4013 domain-containing protein [Methanocorpusculum sp.]|nr:DUF4013 domain-containing protein [Methanocorpusculum sp.]